MSEEADRGGDSIDARRGLRNSLGNDAVLLGALSVQYLPVPCPTLEEKVLVAKGRFEVSCFSRVQRKNEYII